MYKRVQYQTITKRLKEPRHFLQVVLGPRQVGKTTVIKQVVNDLNLPYQIYSADSIPATQTSWISDCWNTARVHWTACNRRNHFVMTAVINTRIWSDLDI